MSARAPFLQTCVAVKDVLETYMAKKDVRPVLASLPVLFCKTQAATWTTLEQCLEAAIQQYIVSTVTSPDAVTTACALWRTALFVIVVLMEAWS